MQSHFFFFLNVSKKRLALEGILSESQTEKI